MSVYLYIYKALEGGRDIVPVRDNLFQICRIDGMADFSKYQECLSLQENVQWQLWNQSGQWKKSQLYLLALLPNGHSQLLGIIMRN